MCVLLLCLVYRSIDLIAYTRRPFLCPTASSVSSSIKALAHSFSFKRNGSVKSTTSQSAEASSTTLAAAADDLELNSRRYSSMPEASPSAMPQTDHFTLSTPDTTIPAGMNPDDSSAAPVPGQTTRSGMPAPANARLSTGAGPTTTIRLVSASTSFSSFPIGPGTPQLKPFTPSFDLLLGSPEARGEGKVPVWPLSPGATQERLYPSLDFDAFVKPPKANEDNNGDGTPGPLPQVVINTPAKGTPRTNGTPRSFPKPSNEPNDIFSPTKGSSLAPPDGSLKGKGRPSIPRSDPFIFGSPLPQNNLSNKDFGHAAASVLEEMNRRLSAAGGQKVGVDLLAAPPAASLGGESIFGNTSMASKDDRFGKAHEKQFAKMDSIATHYAAKRGPRAALEEAQVGRAGARGAAGEEARERRHACH